MRTYVLILVYYSLFIKRKLTNIKGLTSRYDHGMIYLVAKKD
ncbi:hypothetical protein JOE49_002906 [Paenibacillus sp. PvR133]|nr:hypothetical protein [Paenibacillus sp. PvR133]